MISNLIKKFFFTKIPITESEKLEKELKEKKEEIEKQKKFFLKTFEELKKEKKEVEKSRNSLLNILEDITESEKIIKIQKEILDDTINYFIHGIILFGKKGEILLINQKTFEMFGIKKTGLEKKNHEMLKGNEFFIKILEFLKQKQIKEKNFNFGRYYIKMDRIMFKKSSTIDCLIVLNDVTRERESQQAQSDFVALTAHQLRTPLSGMRWTLEMFLDGSFGKMSDEQKTYIKQLKNNSERLIKIVSKFLDIARIEQGRLIEKKEIFDIVDIIDKNIKEANSLIKKKEIDLSFVFSKNIITRVDGDREKLKVVIQNLLENAIRYIDKKGRIEIELKNDEKNLVFLIKDNGCGIPIEEQKKIFTKFFRSSNVKKIDTEGSGLGLFVVKNIIEAHNGNIWFESDGKNKGATFYFTLPIAK